VLLALVAVSCVGIVLKADGTDEVPLPSPALKGKLSVEEALARRRSVREYRKDALSLAEASQLLWAAQGVTERREGFRTAPSAGATYPLEVYLVAGNVSGLAPGLYRYDPGRHCLIRAIAEDIRSKLSEAALGQPWVRQAPATIAIAAVYARTASRYGSRARRYIDMEVGHAGQSIYLQAESLGLGTVAVGAFDDGGVKRVLGLPKEEEPLYLMPVGKKG
jgi:SagB-type dehydrogenase family enzyme